MVDLFVNRIKQSKAKHSRARSMLGIPKDVTNSEYATNISQISKQLYCPPILEDFIKVKKPVPQNSLVPESMLESEYTVVPQEVPQETIVLKDKSLSKIRLRNKMFEGFKDAQTKLKKNKKLTEMAKMYELKEKNKSKESCIKQKSN